MADGKWFMVLCSPGGDEAEPAQRVLLVMPKAHLILLLSFSCPESLLAVGSWLDLVLKVPG